MRCLYTHSGLASYYKTVGTVAANETPRHKFVFPGTSYISLVPSSRPRCIFVRRRSQVFIRRSRSSICTFLSWKECSFFVAFEYIVRFGSECAAFMSPSAPFPLLRRVPVHFVFEAPPTLVFPSVRFGHHFLCRSPSPIHGRKLTNRVSEWNFFMTLNLNTEQ